MSIGSDIYGYRNNFGCKNYSIKKGKSTKIKLFNLIIDGFMTVSKFDDDYFISIAQYLMKKGYPQILTITKGGNKNNIQRFFMDALFSINPYHFQALMINYNKFNIFEWRKQFESFNEIKIKGLNFYKNRSSMPLENFTSMSNIYNCILNFSPDSYEVLRYNFNSCHKDAIWILSKQIIVTKEEYTYRIIYGCKDDFKNMKKNSAHSSWDINIKSEPEENYIDFCLRIYQNYNAVIYGDMNILIPEETWNYFKLSTPSINK